MRITSFKIDSYSIHVYAKDRKGSRTRWGDKLIYFYSNGKHVAQAVFAREGFKAPEPYFSDGIIYFFAKGYQYRPVIDLLRNEKPVYIAWRPIAAPKEPKDGMPISMLGKNQGKQSNSKGQVNRRKRCE